MIRDAGTKKYLCPSCFNFYTFYQLILVIDLRDRIREYRQHLEQEEKSTVNEASFEQAETPLLYQQKISFSKHDICYVATIIISLAAVAIWLAINKNYP